MLAGLLKAPSRLSPARDPKAAEERAQLVLAAMRDEGMIGDKELTTAMSAPATRAPSYWTGSENYVADRIMEELPGLIGDVRSDIVVDTTVDLNLQKLAEQSIRRLIDESGKKLNVSQGALVSIDNSGAVRAMVGGYDYSNQPVRPRLGSAPPAGLGVQAVRLHGGAGSRAARPTACATTRRSRSANGRPTITTASISAR